MIDIVVADDHAIFRDGLRRLLEAEPGFRVVGEAADGLEAIKLARRLEPDVMLLDVAMPGLSGLDVLAGLSASAKHVRPILLTAAITPTDMVEALRRGAWGVVLKESASQLLFKCIRCVVAGQYWVGHEGVASLVEVLRRQALAGGPNGGEWPFGLTRREMEMVSAILAGDANKDIAQRFAISEQTVKHHLTSIYAKLGVANRLELALLAIERGLVAHAPDRLRRKSDPLHS